MKKIAVLFFTLILVLSQLACGESQSNKGSTLAVPNSPSKNETTSEPIIINSGTTHILTEQNGTTTQTERKKAEETIDYDEPLVIVDDDYCIISIVSRYQDDLFVGYVALVENKTDDTISVDLDDVSVDGFMNIVTNKNTTITARNKGYVKFAVVNGAREDVSSRSPNVKKMDDLKNVKGTMKVYSKDGSRLNRLDTLEITIPTLEPTTTNNGATQIVTEQNGTTTQTERKKTEETIDYDEPLVIVDDDYCIISIVSRYQDDLFVGYVALVENKTDDTISVDLDDVSIDGFMNIVTNKNTTITAGNKGYVNFAVVNGAREDVSSRSPNVKKMDDLKNVKGKMKVYSKDGSRLNRLDTIEITIP